MKPNNEFNLDNTSFTKSVELLYLEPEELLNNIYSELKEAGLPDFIAVPATLKAFNLTRDAVTQTMKLVFENQVDVSEWGIND